jgi:hypothetical protein
MCDKTYSSRNCTLSNACAFHKPFNPPTPTDDPPTPTDDPPTPHIFKIDDVLTVLKHLAKIQALSEEQFMLYDFFENGRITINNALEILKHLAGISSKLN